jgi:hypothetical protein
MNPILRLSPTRALHRVRSQQWYFCINQFLLALLQLGAHKAAARMTLVHLF